MMRSDVAAMRSAARPARRRRRRAIACDDVADEAAVLRPARREAGRFVAAPDHHVGGGFDLVELVAIDELLVAGEVEHARARTRAARAPMENSTALPRPPPTSVTVSPAGDLGRRTGRTHQDHRLAGLEHRRRGRRIRPSPARWSIPVPVSRSTQAPVSASPSIARRVPSTFVRMGVEILKSIELAGLEVPRRQRRAHHHLDDGGREAVDALHAGA